MASLLERIPPHTLLGLALAITLAVPAAAQDGAAAGQTRAGGLAAEREAKSQNLAPPSRSWLERTLYWYDSHDAKFQWRGMHYGGGSFPNGAGFGYGIGFTRRALGSALVDPDQPNRIDVDLLAARSTRGYQRLAARLDLLNAAGTPVDFTVRWQDYRLPQEDFHGFGPHSQEGNRTNYRLDGSEAGAGVRWRPSEGAALGGTLSVLTPSLGRGTDHRYPATEDAFEPSTLPGFETLSTFIRSDLSIAFDWRDSATHPRRGGHYRATASAYNDHNLGRYDFRRLDVAVQQILPLPNAYRRLEVRATAAFTDAANGQRVPLIYQPALGGAHTLRGYRDARFRDRHSVSMSAEYQWEAWWALDAALFVDAGQVMPRLRDFTAKDVEVTYGVGFRMHSDTAFLARLDLAFSREGFVPLLGFQYGF
ncbi:MAG: BamA/TamA family outer membrane protein [Vicinamibacterales bacterium]